MCKQIYLPVGFVTPRSRNTYLVTYSDSRLHFFDLLAISIFCFLIIYAIVLHWIRIRGLGVNPSLNQGPDLSVFLDLVFSVVRFHRFKFQILFFNILKIS